MRSPLRLALAVLIVIIGSIAAVGVAGAAGAPEAIALDISTSASGNPDQAVFDYTIDNVTCINGSEVTVVGVDGAVVTQTDDNNGTITLPVGTPGGGYDVNVDCDSGKGVISGTVTIFFATVTVDKVVTGDVPADATFPVSISCSGGVGLTAPTDAFAAEGAGFLLDATFSFDAGGGSKYLVAYGPQGCTVSETDDGGAASSSLDLNDCDGGRVPAVDSAATEAAGPSGTFDVIDPTDCTQTITNSFAEAPAAQPAVVVQVQPAFTG